MNISLKSLIIAVPVILILIVLILMSLGKGFASLYYIDFENHFSLSNDQQNTSLAEKKLAKAAFYAGQDARYYHYSGIIKVLKTSNLEINPKERQQLIQQAIDDYKQALSKQPDNPFIWLNLAQLEFYNQNPEYEQYLDTAIKYGASQQEVSLSYLDIKLHNWKKLDKKSQNNLINLIEYTILAKDFQFNRNKYRYKLNQIMVKHRIKFQICSRLKRDPKIKQFCRLKPHQLPK